jgi:cell wall-associated NlpC family hydrolase
MTTLALAAAGAAIAAPLLSEWQVKIVAEARSLIGTPFQHQARLPGVALDCAGELIIVGRRIGSVPADFDETGYPKAADGRTLMAYLDRFLERIYGAPQAGDVGVYVWGGLHAHHVGVLVPYRHGGLSIVHAAGPNPPAKVLESRLLPHMRRVAAFRFKVA